MADRMRAVVTATVHGIREIGMVRLALAVGVLFVATWAYGLLGGLLLAIAGVVTGEFISSAAAPADTPMNGQQRFQEEMERARRFGHALTLVRVPGAGPSAAAALTHPSSPVGLTRRIDLAWTEGEDLFLALYDTREEGAAMVVERLRRHGIATDRASVAVFPDGALTAGALRRQVIQEAGAPTSLPLETFQSASAAPLTRYAP